MSSYDPVDLEKIIARIDQQLFEVVLDEKLDLHEINPRCFSDDIAYMLINSDYAGYNSVEELAGHIEQFIKDEAPSVLYADAILRYYAEIPLAIQEAKTRMDYMSALKECRKGREVAKRVRWAFGAKDIAILAKIHQSGKYRKKIEDALEDANFHKESGDFNAKRYDAYLKRA